MAMLEGAVMGAISGAVGAFSLHGAAGFLIEEGVDFTAGLLWDRYVRGQSWNDAVRGGLVNMAFGFGVRGITSAAGAAFRAVRGADVDAPRLRGQCPIGNSFSAATEVATPDGDVPIAEIEAGDTVLAYNEDTGEIGEYEVTHTINHTDEVIIHLYIDGELIETTPEHPFFTDEGEWVDAEDLEVGEEILSLDGDYGTVEAVVVIDDANQPMYNLTVDEAHTFFIGDGDWLVHNVDFCLLPYEEHGLSGSLQISITEAIQQSDPNMLIAVRSRAAFADQFEGFFPNKPMGADNLWKAQYKDLGCGIRYCAVPHGVGANRRIVEGFFLSDLDVGFAVTRNSSGNWVNVPDSSFISMSSYLPNGKPKPGALPFNRRSWGDLPGNLINSTYGYDIVMHGTLANGFIDGIVPWYGRYPNLMAETMYVFGSSGFVGNGYGHKLFKDFVPDDFYRMTRGH